MAVMKTTIMENTRMIMIVTRNPNLMMIYLVAKLLHAGYDMFFLLIKIKFSGSTLFVSICLFYFSFFSLFQENVSFFFLLATFDSNLIT